MSEGSARNTRSTHSEDANFKTIPDRVQINMYRTLGRDVAKWSSVVSDVQRIQGFHGLNVSIITACDCGLEQARFTLTIRVVTILQTIGRNSIQSSLR